MIKGAGMELLASALLAVIESLLPKLTFHHGSPGSKFQQTLPHQTKRFPFLYFRVLVLVNTTRFACYTNNRVCTVFAFFFFVIILTLY